MSNKKEALGKGIRALLDSIDTDISASKSASLESTALVNTITFIPLEQIEVNPFQPRADFETASLQELAASITIHGVIQPVSVRKIAQKKFQLIAGERRLRASKMAGLKEIPAYVRTANDQETLEIALIENIQRENLNAMEIAINYKRLLDECALTQEALAERVGKDRSTVTNYLRLLKLPPEIQLGIKHKQLSMGHARALIAIDNPAAQLAIYKEIVKKDLSVRKAEALVRDYGQRKKTATPARPALPPAYKSVEKQLSAHLGTQVKCRRNTNGKGTLIISFYSDDDLNRLLELLDKD